MNTRVLGAVPKSGKPSTPFGPCDLCSPKAGAKSWEWEVEKEVVLKTPGPLKRSGYLKIIKGHRKEVD